VEDSPAGIGEAVIARHDDGTRTVVSAAPIIRVSTDLLANLGPDSDVVEPDGSLKLDSAGEYRYRFQGVEDPHTLLYKRVDSA
jgi:hypothetical protein